VEADWGSAVALRPSVRLAVGSRGHGTVLRILVSKRLISFTVRISLMRLGMLSGFRMLRRGTDRPSWRQSE